jgi:hypothetical protein
LSVHVAKLFLGLAEARRQFLTDDSHFNTPPSISA